MRKFVDLKCPNCKSDLTDFTDVRDVFKCPKEGTFWKVSEKKEGAILEMIHASSDYKGIMTAKLET